MRHKIIIFVAMLAFLIYGSSIIYAQANAYRGYDNRYDPLIGGVQIEITGASWGSGRWNCSIAFPVTIKGSPSPLNRGVITAGHCIHVDWWWGGDYVDQPRKGPWWDWSNFIGRGTRTTYPHGQSGVGFYLDAALIRLVTCGYYGCFPTRNIAPFIFENGEVYYTYDTRDANGMVGILNYILPSYDMEKRTIAYKSGRTTGLTYGLIISIDSIRRYGDGNVIHDVIEISRCGDFPYRECYYNGRISDYGDSGSPVYIRTPIYSYRIDGFRVYHYGATVIGILIGTPADDPHYRFADATRAVYVQYTWKDIEWVTCGTDVTKCL
jgi:hypothetical protein